MGQVAWSHYTSLEDDAAGAHLPPSAKMRDSIAGIRQVVSGYCASKVAAPPAAGGPAGPDLCRELAQRSR